jgi:hypothetical protein
MMLGSTEGVTVAWLTDFLLRQVPARMVEERENHAQ